MVNILPPPRNKHQHRFVKRVYKNINKRMLTVTKNGGSSREIKYKQIVHSLVCILVKNQEREQINWNLMATI